MIQELFLLCEFCELQNLFSFITTKTTESANFNSDLNLCVETKPVERRNKTEAIVCVLLFHNCIILLSIVQC